MPNTFIDNRDAWLRMSDIDYAGQFVKVWLAFNAWYRSAYTETRDRAIFNEIKWQNNPILSTLRPRLEATSEDASQFRSEIGLLRRRLEDYEITSGKGSEKRRIWFRRVLLRANAPGIERETKYAIEFKVDLHANRQVSAVVTRIRSGTIILTLPACPHNADTLKAVPAFMTLSQTQQAILLQVYERAAPDWYCDLTTYEDANSQPIKCGAFEFKCGSDQLFAGVVEVLYLMRCTLFHGELVPTKDAVACYEPAFRLVRRFLDCVV